MYFAREEEFQGILWNITVSLNKTETLGVWKFGQFSAAVMIMVFISCSSSFQHEGKLLQSTATNTG